MRVARASSAVVALTMMWAWASLAHAGPPDQDSAQGEAELEVQPAEPASAELPEDPGEDPSGDQLGRVRKLFALGAAKFDLGDCGGAIEAWEEAYALAPVELRGQLYVPLANAHVCQYEGDALVDHMRRAAVLFNDALEALDADDVETRAQTEAMLAEVRAEIARVEAAEAERERELAEREAQAREQAAREIVSQQLHDLEPYTEAHKRRFRRLVGLGGALVAGGAGGLVVMATALVLGQRVDVEGAALSPAAPYEDYVALRSEGQAWNATAMATGVVGGALLVSGAATLVYAVFDREHAKQEIRGRAARLGPRLSPRLGGLELRF